MNKYNHYQKIICLGDESRYLFIRELFPENIRSHVTYDELCNNDVFITYNEKNDFEKLSEENKIMISLNSISISKLIYIPVDIFNIRNEEKHIDKLLMFNSFPYGKLNIIEDLKYVMDNNDTSEVLGVLYREERNFSSTDLSSEEESIIEAMRKYAKRGIKTIIHKPGDYGEDIFEISPDFIRMFKDSYKSKYFKVKERFIERYEREYDFNIKDYFNMFTILDPEKYQRFDDIFSFDQVRNSNDIWKTFMFNYEKKYMDGEFGVLNQLRDLYVEFIKDVFVWNLDEDLSKLNETILEAYNEHFGQEKVLKTPDSELEYIKLLNCEEGNSLDVIFKNKLKSFAESKLKIILHKYIDKRLNNSIKLKMEDKNYEDN